MENNNDLEKLIRDLNDHMMSADESLKKLIFADKKYRKQKGITQKQLAEQCSYSENFIGDLENNTFKTCSLNTLYYISKKLGIHMKDLFDELEEDIKNKSDED